MYGSIDSGSCWTGGKLEIEIVLKKYEDQVDVRFEIANEARNGWTLA